MKTPRFVFSALTAIVAVSLGFGVLSLNSCKRNGTEIPVTGVSVNQPAFSITEGETAVISYSVEPSDASVKDVSFSSSDTSVATVDNTGRVTAVAPGSATITVTSKDGGFTASVTVTVIAKGSVGVAVTGILLDNSEVTLELGSTFTFTVTVEPDNATDKGVIWKSSKPSAVIVDDYGMISAMGIGTATITATSKSNPAISAKCDVTVVNKGVVQSPKKVTVAEFIAAPESDSQKYELVGIIDGSINTTYGDFYLYDETGSVRVYGLTATDLGYGAKNDKSFSSLGLHAGDKIRIIGYRLSFSSTPEVAYAYFVEKL